MAPHWVGMALAWAGVGCGQACIFHFCGSGGKEQPERRLERVGCPSGGGCSGGGGRGHFSGNTKKESMGLPLSMTVNNKPSWVLGSWPRLPLPQVRGHWKGERGAWLTTR